MQASFSVDPNGRTFFTGGVAGGYGLLVLPQYRWQYVLGLLNSSVLDWVVRQTATPMRGGYYSFESRFIRNLPIRAVDPSDARDGSLYSQMAALVEQILQLHTRLHTARSERDKDLYQRQIDAKDREIDRLVYDLYGLTDDEIRIVESSH
jgi:hypothetical protein